MLAYAPRASGRVNVVSRGGRIVAKRAVEVRVRAAEGTVEAPNASPIVLTDNALTHLKRLKEDKGSDNMLLRIGVRQGGCSGMSYHMDFEEESNIKPDDAVMQYDDSFQMVCDPKSLLYLFGMRLDYSDALIGGGFQFHNPNAEDTCGCGKSFGV